DASGRRIAFVTDDGETDSLDPDRVIPYKIGGMKVFDILDDAEYRVEIESYTYGSMNYTVYSGYDPEAGDFAENKTIALVELVPEMKFESRVGGDIRAEEVELEVVDEGTDTMELLVRELEKQVREGPEEPPVDPGPGTPDSGSGIPVYLVGMLSMLMLTAAARILGI
ncbi:MAG: hypothetical protein J6Z23_02515, partial [Lachnospiraceae bacterium]|nr:hypothetical protein [Lachnospiraceae bacterium]